MKIIIQQLTDELRSIVRWGITPRLVSRLPILGQLAEIEPDTKDKDAAQLVHWYLSKAIAALDDTCECCDRTIAAEKVRLAYRVLFRFSHSKDKVARRRQRAMELLGMAQTHALRDWSDRVDGDERDLLLILAERLLQTAPKAGEILD